MYVLDIQYLLSIGSTIKTLLRISQLLPQQYYWEILMDVRQCKVNHQDFLQHLEEFDHEEVIPTETDLHMRYIA